jgi:hypothetical protein
MQNIGAAFPQGRFSASKACAPSWAFASSPSKLAIVGRCIRSRSLKLNPASGRLRIRAITFRLDNESPPMAKKLSVSPMRSTPSTSCQIFASILAWSVEGARYVRPVAAPGSGNALRSSLPLGSRGSSASIMICAGSMYSGRRLPSSCLSRRTRSGGCMPSIDTT